MSKSFIQHICVLKNSIFNLFTWLHLNTLLKKLGAIFPK